MKIFYLRKEDTPEAREIWRAVDNAASKAPDWLREKIEKVLEEV